MLYDGQVVQFEGTVYHKEIKNDKYIYFIKNSTVNANNSKIDKLSLVLNLSSDDIPNHSKIRATGTVQKFENARNEGNFDSKEYYNSLGLQCKITDISSIEYYTLHILKRDIFYRLQKNISAFYLNELPGEEAGFLSSMVIGDKSSLDTELKDLFQRVGIVHILAVSGLHVSTICMGVFSFLRKRGKGFAFSSFFSGIIAVMYGILTGLSVSSIRAIGMFLFYLGAQVLGEAYDMITAMSIMAVLLLLQNPLYISNSSFILSFSAIIAVNYFSIPLCASFNRFISSYTESKIPQKGIAYKYNKSFAKSCVEAIGNSLCFSLAITVAMLPVVTSCYYQFPLYSVFVNMLIGPIMPFILIVGLIGGLVGIAFPLLGHILMHPCHALIFILELVSDLAANLPHSTIITGKTSAVKTIIFYIVLIALLVFSQRKKSNKFYFEFIFKILTYTLTSLILVFSPCKSFEIDVLDVGQGDGIYIQEGNSSFFIDGGSTDVTEVGKYRILPFLKAKGAKSIDYWFISHTDEDHMSGLLEVMEEGYKIKNIVLSKQMADSGNYESIYELAKENNTNLLFMSAGDTCGNRKVSFKCLYPNINDKSDDINDLCLCLLLTYDKNADGIAEFRGFFGGDIGDEVEQKLATSSQLSKVDFLKVSHHGSKYSSNEDFLNALKPKLAVVSCAKVNSYGHPAAETIDRIESITKNIFYTMDSGEISIFYKKNKVSVKTLL